MPLLVLSPTNHQLLLLKLLLLSTHIVGDNTNNGKKHKKTSKPLKILSQRPFLNGIVKKNTPRETEVKKRLSSRFMPLLVLSPTNHQLLLFKIATLSTHIVGDNTNNGKRFYQLFFTYYTK